MADTGVDILVIGGGITGAGVALDAAARGYRVGLVERADFASGTSSKSTKLVHGGIRYLPQFDFGLVHEGLVERGLLVRNAPYLVHRLGFVLPLFKENKRPLGTPIVPPFGLGMTYLLQSGLLLYDILAGRLGLARHRRIGVRNAERLMPCLRTDGLLDAYMYYDGQTDDTRLTLAVIRTAVEQGAAVANYAEVTGFDRADDRITAALVRDQVSGDLLRIPVETVINAAGVFAGQVEALTGEQSHVRIQPAKGVHLTVPYEALRLGRYAIVFPETEDGRLLFVVPWGPRVIIGTTDTEGGDLERPEAAPADVAYILRHVNRYMQCSLTEADVISTWAGYRPLVSSRDPNEPSSRLSRTHVVIDSPGGMVTITGGKLTTYRRMAQDAVDHVLRRRGAPIHHVTEHLPLAGSAGWEAVEAVIAAAGPRYGFSPATVRRLRSYGAAAHRILDLVEAEPNLARPIVPDLPYILAEVVYACRYEMAITLDDVFERRTHIAFEDWAHGLEAAPEVARLMARELDWSAEETAQQLACYTPHAHEFSAGLARVVAPPPAAVAPGVEMH